MFRSLLLTKKSPKIIKKSPKNVIFGIFGALQLSKPVFGGSWWPILVDSWWEVQGTTNDQKMQKNLVLQFPRGDIGIMTGPISVLLVIGCFVRRLVILVQISIIDIWYQISKISLSIPVLISILVDVDLYLFLYLHKMPCQFLD